MKKFFRRTPRIIAIIYIAFMCRSTLSNFQSSTDMWIISSIVILALITLLIISWKKQLAGGIIFTLMGLIYLYIYFFVFESSKAWIPGAAIQRRFTTAIPTLLAGILFFINRLQERKNK